VGGPVTKYWFYEPDKMIISEVDPPAAGSSEVVSFDSSLGRPHIAHPRVAILTGRHTSSAAEGIAVSFIGSGMSRTFGESTAGRSSANIGRTLPDGALLIITYGKFADRNGNLHWPQVVPDEHVTELELFPTIENDRAIAAAVKWLRASEKCGSTSQRSPAR